MNIVHEDASIVLLEKVGDWLVKSALAGEELEGIIAGFCERLAAAGLPLARIHFSFSVLHPLYRATGFTWLRGKGVTAESYRHVVSSQTDRFSSSPYYYLLSNGLDHLRRRIDYSGPSEFPVFEDFKELGLTDYLAFVQSLDSKTGQAMMGSWSTDRAEGFSDSTISALLHVQSQLAAAAKIAVLRKLAENVLATYLGSNAGGRVMNGQIKRGDGETIRAAVIMADMRGSTMLVEKQGRQAFVDTLNQFFDAIATPFNGGAGQILSFVGDGFLAAFPCERDKRHSQIACRAALSAAQLAVDRMAKLNGERRATGQVEIGYGIGLHIGNVMFGNVGLIDRMTFSVFGAAANEVQRLEALTKKYPVQIVASDAFVNYCDADWTLLGAETLRGVARSMNMFTPRFTKAALPGAIEVIEPSNPPLSDAEQLVILHRQSQKPPEVKAST
jgi:adenylate cyclase